MADAIPPFLDPLLDYLADSLPSPLYSLLEALLHHSIVFLSSLYTLAIALITSHPSTWEPEKILPPIITLLAAYLALLSFYRTTAWMVRTVFWFAKWGVILTTLGVGLGYLIANGNGGNGIALGALLDGGRVLTTVGGHLLNAMNGGGAGDGQNGGAGGAFSSRRAGSNSRSKQPRPKAYESWDKQQQWQYQQANDQTQEGADVQKVIGDILGGTAKMVKESSWWEAAKGVVDEYSQGAQGSSKGRRRARRNGDTESETSPR